MKVLVLKNLIKEVILEMYDMSPTSGAGIGRGFSLKTVGTIENPTNKVQTALLILGIDSSLIYGVRNMKKGISYNPNSKVSGGFWNRNDEYYWNILEMARNNYIFLIKKYHPDVSGKEGEEKTKQLNSSWDLIRKSFAKKGYELP